MAKSAVRQISLFINGKELEGTIKNIAAEFRKAQNELANMVVGSDAYLAKLEEVQKLDAHLAEHRKRLKETGDAAAGSVNALQQELAEETRALNNLTVGTDEYNAKLQSVQQQEAQLTAIRKAQQTENRATAGSINALQEQLTEETKILNNLVVGSDEYNAKLKSVREQEARLAAVRKEQQVENRAVAGSLRAIEEELAREKALLKELVIESEEYQAQLKKVHQLDDQLAKHTAGLRGVKQGYSLLQAGVGQFVGLAAGAFTVDSLLAYGKQLFSTGVSMEGMAKKARTVFGEALPQISAEAQKNARDMGLTNSQYIAAAANIQDLLVPMGFQRKEAADISTQLVNLSGALSEWSTEQDTAEEVSQKLNKALLGEREELKSVGISISEADVQAQLAAKGLDKLTGSALEQAKATATLELILNKSKDAQAQYAAGADSAARRQAQLSASITEITEKLSKTLFPIFERLVGIASSVVGTFDRIADGIGAMVDPAGAATKAFDEQAQTVSSLESDIVPLLNRYDQLAGKTDRNASEQDELQKIITTVSGVIPTAIEGFDAYGRALGLNTTKAREFIETERARLKFINQEAIAATDKQIKDAEKRAEELSKQLNSGQTITTTGTGFNQRLERRDLTADEIRELQTEAAKLQETVKGANAELTRLRGDNLKTPDKPVETTTTGGGGTDTNAGKPDKGTLNEAKKLQEDLTELIKRTTELRFELITKAQDDELATTIQGIEKRYDAEIAKATELEKKGFEEATAQRIALEQLKQEEIGLAVEENTKQAVQQAEASAKEQAEKSAAAVKEAFEKDNEERAQFFEDKQAAEAELKAFRDEALLTEQQLELQQLEEHYTQLLALAQKYGFDTVALTEAYSKQKSEVLTKYQTEDQTALKAAMADLQQAQIQAFSGGAEALAGFFEESSAVGKALFLFQKSVAAAEILINLPVEISKIAAANATLGIAGAPITAAQIAAAKIRAGIGLATIAASAIKGFVKQKKEGGYLDVVGEDDRRTYHASVIPTPSTGLLPDYPVLFRSNATGNPVLASERGSEYFVSSEALRNPVVANLTRMIDNITVTGGRVAQFADGGSNPAPTTPSTPAPVATPAMDMTVMKNLTEAVNNLNMLLASGIVAIVPDGTVVDIHKRFEIINSASGGYYSY